MSEETLYTLTEVSKRTDISMPTLQRYKKLYQDRIPSSGEGRSQRYPEEALEVFRELKTESMGRRGRPRKTPRDESTEPARRPAAKSGRGRSRRSEPAGAGEDLLTLTQIEKLTGISYPTLLRYSKAHLDKIPHHGSGRARRYLPEAVDVFKELRAESGRGGRGRGRRKSAPETPPSRGRRGRVPAAASNGGSAALADRIKALEKQQKQLERIIVKLEKKIEKPVRITLQR